MQETLRTYYLQFPQVGEQILYQRYDMWSFSWTTTDNTGSACGDVIIGDQYIIDASMTMLFDPGIKKHRIIILSGSNDTSISMERGSYSNPQTIEMKTPPNESVAYSP